MKPRMTGLLAAVMLGACGGPDAPVAPESASDTPGDDMESRIFDMPYLMRDLDNGLRVIVVPTDYPDIVTLQIPVQTGSRNEVEPGKSGFAHFFEHMMFRGTEKYPAEVYADTMKKAGANQNAYTTDDFTNYHVTFTKADLEKMIEIEADRFQNLDYSESDFRTEALAVKGEYLKNFSDPTSQAYERVRSLAFDTHTYGHTTMGFIEDIEAMPDQIDYSREFFSRWYRPEKTAVIIVGDVDPEATYALVEKYWGGWEQGDYDVEIPAEPAPDGALYEHMQWEGETQPWLFIAYRGPAYRPTEKDMPAMDVLASVYFSDSSDLYQKLVLEDQQVDQLLTYFPNRKDPNLLMIYARLTDEAHGPAVARAIGNTLVEARTELIPADMMEKTKSRLRYSFTSQLDNSGSIGSMLAGFVHFWRTPETVNEAYRTYDALTGEDIRAAANRYFIDDARVTVSLSNSPSMPGVNESLDIDAAVEASGMAEPADTDSISDALPIDMLTYEPQGEPVPLEIVAFPLPSSPLVDVSLIVHAGAGMDPPGKKGLAALTAAMITDAGSEQFSIDQINDAMYPIASGFGAQVDKEMTRLSGQVHKDNLDTWYRYISSQLLTPGWRQQDFERVRTQLVNAIRTGLVGNNDEELGKEALYVTIYGPGHPYGSLNLGHSADLRKMTLQDVKDFYAKYYTVNNLTVGLAGGYPDSFVTQMESDLQSLPRGERTKLSVPPAPAIEANSALIVEKETPAVAVSFGFPIELRRGDPDWVALWLARSYFGEHRSTNSHLYQRIRETRGMNYGDYAYIEYFPNGMFQMQPGTNYGRQEQIFQVWIRPLRNNNDAHFATRTALFELEKLVENGMSESDFEATRAFLSKFVSLLTDGQSRQLAYALDSQYYGIQAFADYVRDGLDRLSLADVNRVIRENLRTEDIRYVFVTKDAADLKARLVDDRPSPIRYDAEKPAALLEEDKQIEAIPMELDESAVSIVPASKIFD